MTEKPKVAFYWCASCGGCEEAVVDLAEDLLRVTSAVEIVLWPVAMDFKRADLAAMPDGSIMAAFVNGAIRTSEQEEMAHLVRSKSRLLIAFGACAHLGGVPGLANLWNRQDIFATVYADSIPPQTQWQDDGHSLRLPTFFDTVRTLDQVVDVDYYVPGCPPTPQITQQALETLLRGELPPRGSVLAPDRALCEECPRRDTRPEKLTLAQFHRPHEVLIDEEKCFLAQGLLCMGPATRGGCEALCIHGNMPCTGCFGPTSRVRDYGGKALSMVASLVGSNEQEEIHKVLDAIPDPTGTFYRYSLPASLLRRKIREEDSHAG